MLEAQYESMTAHIRRVASMLSPNGLWDKGFQFGDWLDPDAPPERPGDAKTHAGIVATAYFHRSALLTSRAAALLGLEADARHYGDLADRIAEAFRDEIAAGALLVLDGGVLGNVPPSTLVDCTGPMPRMVREGAIPRAELRRAAGRLAP